MSKIGDIYNSYGSQFNVSIANTYSYIVLSGNNLPANSFIIASNTNEDNDDTGTYSVLLTDYQGNPVRLTYTIQEGNGLIYDNDSLKLKTDFTFDNSTYNLSIDINTLIDNKTITFNKNTLSINTSNLNVADENNIGIIKVDGKTITSDEGKIFVQTQNLEYANNDSNMYGVFSSDDDGIDINNGIVSVNATQLRKCDENKFGVAKCDEYTLYMNNGIRLNSENLDKVSDKNYGITKGSDTIDINDGIMKVTDNLPIGSSTTNGILSFDGITIIKNNNEQLSINNYKEFLDSLSKIEDDTNKIFNELKGIKQNILSSVSL